MVTSENDEPRAFLLGTASCIGLLLVFQLFGAISRRRERAKVDCRQRLRTLDGNHLYYGRAAWPVYDARFNLKLSWLYEPVLLVKQSPTSLRARLCRVLNNSADPARGHSDATILINSFRWGKDRRLERLLTDCISRAPSIAAGKYLSRGKRIVLMPYGPDWKRHQSAFARLLTREKVKKEWGEAVRFEAMKMIQSLKSTHCFDKVAEEISRFTASSVLQVAYARRAATLDDPILKELATVSKNMNSAFKPGNYLVDMFPLLDIFPVIVSPWKRKLNADHAFEMSVYSGLLDVVERRLEDDVCHKHQDLDVFIPVKQCAAAQLLRGEDKFDRGEIAYLAAGLFEAGTETTAMTITTFLLGAAANRKQVKMAYGEITTLMSGRKFVPDFQGLELFSSGYVSGFVREALRLTPTCSSGMTHTTTKPSLHHLEVHGAAEDEAVMVEIPSGATVLANIYGLHHDPEVFPDPWSFDPGRWLPFPQNTVDYTHACSAFGFGRRRCPGSRLASYSMTMAIVLLLWCFDFELKLEVGREMCAELVRQEVDECERWQQLFPDEEKKENVTSAVKEGGAQMCGPLGENAYICRLLMDAYTTFKLSSAQVAKCLRLVPRSSFSDGDPFDKLEHTLVELRNQRRKDSKS